MFSVSHLSSYKIQQFLAKYGLNIRLIPCRFAIPYSFWGSPEAGRLNNTLYARADTPLHSLLHETAHYVCMSPKARILPQLDAAGDAVQESACCYLQLLWSEALAPFNFDQHCIDMDTWGYSFRLGCAQRWFAHDADDARDWLISHQIIDSHNQISWKLRS